MNTDIMYERNGRMMGYALRGLLDGFSGQKQRSHSWFSATRESVSQLAESAIDNGKRQKIGSEKPPVILLPVDLTRESFLAARTGIRLARDLGGRLIILHAVQLTLMPYGPANLPRLKAGLRRETMTALKPLSGLAEAAGVDAKLVVEDVPASVAILKASEQNNASLIVMAAQPHSWWQKLVGANTVKCVSQKARCPVVVLEREEKRAKESNKLWRTPSNLVESWKQV